MTNPLHLLANDTQAPVANAAWVRNALNSQWENRAVIPINLSGATGKMSVSYDQTTGQGVLDPLLPLSTDANVTQEGMALIADGATYRNTAVKHVLLGTGVPANSLGWDGAFYRDTASNLEYGPKAAGVWPAQGKLWISEQDRANYPRITGAPTAGTAALVSGSSYMMQAYAGATTIGTWTYGTNGYAIPEDGTYVLALEYPVNNQTAGAGNSARVIADLLINNVAPSAGARRSIYYITSDGNTGGSGAGGPVVFNSGELQLTAGQELGLRLTIAQQNLAAFEDWGRFEIKRVR